MAGSPNYSLLEAGGVEAIQKSRERIGGAGLKVDGSGIYPGLSIAAYPGLSIAAYPGLSIAAYPGLSIAAQEELAVEELTVAITNDVRGK